MNARKQAWEILNGVFIDGKYANLVMRSSLKMLAENDKALVTQIVYGTIRNYRWLFYQFEDLWKREPDYQIRILLAMSVYQLFFLDKVPDYAIINEAVELAKTYKNGAFTSLVNALLRAIQKRGLQDSDRESIIYSYPDFIVKLLRSQYGNQLTTAFMKAGNQNAQVTMSANTIKTTTRDLLKDEAFSCDSSGMLKYDGDVFSSRYFKEGEVLIQDYSASQVVKLLAPKPGNTVLDICAAPGTKTAQMAGMMNNTGKITAVDIHEHRVRLLDEAMEKLGVKIVESLVKDGRQAAQCFTADSFDRILFDAPCSGLGVLKQKPEIKLRLKPEDFAELILLQRDIFKGIAGLLKSGGTLCYSTCTLNLNENQKQVAWFLKEYPNYRLNKNRTIWPNNVHDGFYMAQLLRYK